MHTSYTHQQYRHLFLKAASVVWKNKWLIVPGLFISLLANLGFYELFLGNADSLIPKFNWSFLLPVISAQGLVARLSALNIVVTLILFVLAAAIVFGLLFLAAWALGTVIVLVQHLADNKPCSWSKAWNDARPFIWPILFVAIVAKTISYISLNLISVPLLSLVSGGGLLNYLIYFSAFILFITLSILTSVLMYYTILYMVLEKLPLIRAVESAVWLFLRHWLVTLEFGVILLTLNVLTTVAFGFFASLLAFPFLLFLIIAGLIQSPIILAAATITLIMVFTASLIVATGFVMAFYITSWTLLFLNLEENFSAKLHRLFHPFTFLYKKLFSR